MVSIPSNRRRGSTTIAAASRCNCFMKAWTAESAIRLPACTVGGKTVQTVQYKNIPVECRECHRNFDHDRTAFALTGVHRGLDCQTLPQRQDPQHPENRNKRQRAKRNARFAISRRTWGTQKNCRRMPLRQELAGGAMVSQGRRRQAGQAAKKSVNMKKYLLILFLLATVPGWPRKRSRTFYFRGALYQDWMGFKSGSDDLFSRLSTRLNLTLWNRPGNGWTMFFWTCATVSLRAKGGEPAAHL